MPAKPGESGAVLAVVVARAGSKGVPGKNTAPIAGRPCVAWTIEHALGAPGVRAVVVSSDSAEVLEIARAMGALAHRRSDALATDTARVDDALREAVAWYEAEHGPIGAAAMLYANVPVRPAGLLDRAVALWRATGCDSVQSYAPVGKHHPWWQVRLGEDGRAQPWEGERLFHGVYRRQELPPSHIPDGGVLVTSRPALFHQLPNLDPAHPHSFLGHDHRGVVNPEGAVIDIDSPSDLIVADTILKLISPQRTQTGAEKGESAADALG
ncbi:MAG: acylneuraminate cytidylyltransferase family protein [Phycisphaerales bacterium]|nr:acylneuraminate cytidylyltransferase family protein [Phycisphaerales bacterium]